jgi:ABC-2 type transport system permease protein
MHNGFSLQRMLSVARKEFFHIIRDPATLFFALFLPILQLFMLGFAIDTNVRNLRTVVLDEAKSEESRQVLQRFEQSGSFKISKHVFSDAELHDQIVAGKARVGIKIPANYSQRVLHGNPPAQILILVDGSDSNAAGTALNVGNLLVAEIARDLAQQDGGSVQPRVVSSPQVLFNPDTRSPNFFIPGLMVVLCQMMAIILSANAIVREKENGTLEQLFMTPVQSSELIFGKLIPYFFLTLIEFCTILLFMRVAFQVPIHGPVLALLFLSVPFAFCFLGLGLLISTRADSRDAAFQMAMGTMMPSIFLSGYIFPLDSMHWFFYGLAQVLPTTWLIDAARGVILRGAGWSELWLHNIVLWGMGLGIFALSVMTYRKRV